MRIVDGAREVFKNDLVYQRLPEEDENTSEFFESMVGDEFAPLFRKMKLQRSGTERQNIDWTEQFATQYVAEPLPKNRATLTRLLLQNSAYNARGYIDDLVSLQLDYVIDNEPPWVLAAAAIVLLKELSAAQTRKDGIRMAAVLGIIPRLDLELSQRNLPIIAGESMGGSIRETMLEFGIHGFIGFVMAARFFKMRGELSVLKEDQRYQSSRQNISLAGWADDVQEDVSLVNALIDDGLKDLRLDWELYVYHEEKFTILWDQEEESWFKGTKMTFLEAGNDIIFNPRLAFQFDVPTNAMTITVQMGAQPSLTCSPYNGLQDFLVESFPVEMERAEEKAFRAENAKFTQLGGTSGLSDGAGVKTEPESMS